MKVGNGSTQQILPLNIHGGCSHSELCFSLTPLEVPQGQEPWFVMKPPTHSRSLRNIWWMDSHKKNVFPLTLYSTGLWIWGGKISKCCPHWAFAVKPASSRELHTRRTELPSPVRDRSPLQSKATSRVFCITMHPRILNERLSPNSSWIHYTDSLAPAYWCLFSI